MWVETERLILREFKTSDLQALAPMLANPRVRKFLPTGILSTRQTAAKINDFMTSYRIYGYGKWAIRFKGSETLVGYCGIAKEKIDEKDEIELGYCLSPEYWGVGLATEAAVGAIKYGFNAFQFPYILGIVGRENLASVKVLQKLGMQFKKTTLFLILKSIWMNNT